MTEPIPDVWPGDFDRNVLSPVAILRHQAGQLRQHTQGLLYAEVFTQFAKEKQVLHEFNLVAPALDSYTFVLFTAWHKKDFIYPVMIQYQPWVDKVNEDFNRDHGGLRGAVAAFSGRGDLPPSGIRTSATQDEFIAALRELLSSPSAKSSVISLLARINDLQDGASKDLKSTIPPSE